MGSLELYDHVQQKWVPYVPDPERMYQHFKDIRDGYARPDHLGRYFVGTGERNRKLKEMEQQRPVVKMVSPVAQANEIAQSEVNREKQRKNGDGKKRKNTTSSLSQVKKRRQEYNLEDALSL